MEELFEKEGTEFFGAAEEFHGYIAGIGTGAVVENNLDAVLETFRLLSRNMEENSLVLCMGEKTVAALIWEKEKGLQMSLFDRQTKEKLKTVLLEDVPDMANNILSGKVIRTIPKMCRFAEEKRKGRKFVRSGGNVEINRD